MFNPFGIGILGAQRNPFAPQPLQVPMPLQAVPMQQLPGPGMTPAPLQPVPMQQQLMPRVGGGITTMPAVAQVPQAASPQFGPPGQAPAPLKPLGPMRAPAVRRSEGFGGLDPQTWFDIAGGFMSGAQNNDWSQALFGVGGALNARQGRRDAQADRQWRKQEQGMALTAEQRAQAGERRAQEAHGTQMTEAQYIQQLRADAQRRWDAARADPNLTPEQRRRLEAVGPEGYADAVVSDYQMQVQAQQAEVEFNRQAGLTREGWQVQSRENARDRASRAQQQEPITLSPQVQNRITESSNNAAQALSGARAAFDFVHTARDAGIGTGVARRIFGGAQLGGAPGLRQFSEDAIASMRMAGTGPFTDADAMRAEDRVPSINASPEENRRRAANIGRNTIYRQQRASHEDAYAMHYGSLAGFETYWREVEPQLMSQIGLMNDYEIQRELGLVIPETALQRESGGSQRRSGNSAQDMSDEQLEAIARRAR